MDNLRKSKASGIENALSFEDQKMKINQVRSRLGPLIEALPNICSEASISRHLRTRNWNVDKASKMLKGNAKWRLKFKPENISWKDVAFEAETGKIYRANYRDKFGRSVLVFRPGFQNTSSLDGQIKYLVYSMENAIMNLAEDQEQMVWLINFERWNMGSVSVKATQETARVLQEYYPERLGLAILYNPPTIFEKFWKIVKPFLDSKTYKKARFVYSENPESQKIMTDLFDMDKLESAFGGRNEDGFDFNKYSEQMKLDDKKMSGLLNSTEFDITVRQPIMSILQQTEPSVSEVHSESSSDSPSCSSDTESRTAENVEEKGQLIHLKESA